MKDEIRIIKFNVEHTYICPHNLEDASEVELTVSMSEETADKLKRTVQGGFDIGLAFEDKVLAEYTKDQLRQSIAKAHKDLRDYEAQLAEFND